MGMVETKKQYLCDGGKSKDSLMILAVFYVASHRSCFFVATLKIMYTLFWKGYGEPFFIT